LLAERGQLNTQFGRSAFSILLFQDVSVLPALALLPLLGMAAAASTGSGWLVLKLVAVLATLIIGGRYVLNPVLRIVAATGVAEAFTAAGLLIVLGTALLVSQVGLSLSLGASWPACCSPTANFVTNWRPTSSPSRACCSGYSLLASGCRPIWNWFGKNPSQ
jgi:predicted Kef-type K+ transport protein